jgi:hypothetical protein
MPRVLEEPQSYVPEGASPSGIVKAVSPSGIPKSCVPERDPLIERPLD